MQSMILQQTEVLRQLESSHHALMGSMTAFSGESEKALARMQQSGTANAQHLEQVASTMDAASQELSQSCQTFVQSVVGGLSQALGMFDQNMTTLVAALTEKIDSLSAQGTSAETAQAAAELQRLLTELKQAIPAKEV